MQYDWVNQLASADRDRRERTLRTAAAQFTSAIDTELSRIGGSLQLDGAMVERQDWDAYAIRYAGRDRQPVAVAGPRRLVRGDGRARVDATTPASCSGNGVPEQRTFDVVPWPDELATVRDPAADAMRQTAPTGPAARAS